jgi:ABC-type transporter Mla maintaining outer membrane lipid asymmetry ATPase subunit MlaF
VVVVTHEVEQIKTIADRVLLFDEARIKFDGTLDDALASDDETLVAFFERRPAVAT